MPTSGYQTRQYRSVQWETGSFKSTRIFWHEVCQCSKDRNKWNCFRLCGEGEPWWRANECITVRQSEPITGRDLQTTQSSVVVVEDNVDEHALAPRTHNLVLVGCSSMIGLYLRCFRFVHPSRTHLFKVRRLLKTWHTMNSGIRWFQKHAFPVVTIPWRAPPVLWLAESPCRSVIDQRVKAQMMAPMVKTIVEHIVPRFTALEGSRPETMEGLNKLVTKMESMQPDVTIISSRVDLFAISTAASLQAHSLRVLQVLHVKLPGSIFVELPRQTLRPPRPLVALSSRCFTTTRFAYGWAILHQ